MPQPGVGLADLLERYGKSRGMGHRTLRHGVAEDIQAVGVILPVWQRTVLNGGIPYQKIEPPGSGRFDGDAGISSKLAVCLV